MTADDKIVLYELDPGFPGNFREVLRLSQMTDVFVFDLSADLDYMVVGMATG